MQVFDRLFFLVLLRTETLPTSRVNFEIFSCSDMKLDTPEIAWHGKEPILSVDFSKVGSTWRLASAGADKDVKVLKNI